MSGRSAGRIAAINVDRALLQHATARTGQPAAGDLSKSSDLTTQATPLDTLTSFIPSEALAFYLAGVSVMAALPKAMSQPTAGWILFGVAQIANAASITWAYREQRTSTRTLTGRRNVEGEAAIADAKAVQLVVAVMTTALAFTLFALTLANGIYRPSAPWQVFVVLIGAFILTGVAKAFALRRINPERTRIR